MGTTDDQRGEKAAELRRKLLAKRWDRAEARDRQREIEARYVLEVSQQEDGSGRRVYPNEHTRRAAVTLRLAADEEYTSLRARTRELAAEAQEITHELGKLSILGQPFGFLDQGV